MTLPHICRETPHRCLHAKAASASKQRTSGLLHSMAYAHVSWPAPRSMPCQIQKSPGKRVLQHDILKKPPESSRAYSMAGFVHW